MKRKVIYARLHDIKVVMAPVGQLDVNLPPNGKTYPGLEMFYDGNILEVNIGGHACGIPTSNVQFMKFAAEDKALAATAKPDTSPKIDLVAAQNHGFKINPKAV